MAHAFQTISAKPTFGTLRPNLYQSDYITRKKANLTFCKTPTYCNKSREFTSYTNLNLFKRSLEKCNVLQDNKSNLIIGQYTKSDMAGVCTVSEINVTPTPCGNTEPCNPCQINDPVQIDNQVLTSTETTSEPFYFKYQIDPLGELFGQSQCGELNYIHYMKFYPPIN